CVRKNNKPHTLHRVSESECIEGEGHIFPNIRFGAYSHQDRKDRSKKETAKKRHNTGRPEATDDGDKLRNCSIEEKGYE
ncbi:hypothetical protein L9F63_022539, partial [Diploptera punctata]